MKKPFVVKAGETRRAQALDILGDTVWVKVSGSDTAGRFCVMEDCTEPLAGPPLHRHNREDEWFYVLEGKFRFVVDGQEIFARAGDSVFAPRGSAHTFQNAGEKAARMLVMTEPAGLDAFFADLAAATAEAGPEPAVIVPVFEKYGLELLGPPLAICDPLDALTGTLQ